MTRPDDSAAASAPGEGAAFDTFLLAASLLGLPHGRERALQLGLATHGRLADVVRCFRDVVVVDPDALALQRGKRAVAPEEARVSFHSADDPDALCGAFDLILCDFRRIPAGRRPLRRIGSLLRLLAPGGVALFDVPRRGLRSWLTVPSAGSTALAWPDLAREAAGASARIAWVDKGRREGTIYCVVRDR